MRESPNSPYSPISSNKSGRLSRNDWKFCKNSVESTNLEVLLRLLPVRFRNIDTFNRKHVYFFRGCGKVRIVRTVPNSTNNSGCLSRNRWYFLYISFLDSTNLEVLLPLHGLVIRRLSILNISRFLCSTENKFGFFSI